MSTSGSGDSSRLARALVSLTPAEPRTIADRLRQTRSANFVGRRAERELFSAALDAPEPPFTALFLHGPGGVGKSALLAEFSDIAVASGAHVVHMDARTLDLGPEVFKAAVASPPGGARLVLLIDTYELLAPMDGWLRTELLPTLPADAVVVIAGREPPAPAWLAWQDLVRGIALRNLPRPDAETYLRTAGVPADLHEDILDETYGHPLALALLVDVVDQRGAVSLRDSPDVVRTLLERFIAGVPGPRHRAALEVCAHARYTTEELLRAVLPGPDTGELFAWLRGLSFIAEATEGLHPHDIVRDVLDADLRWRDEATYTDLHRRVREHIIARIRRTTGREQQRSVCDLNYLHRTSPILGAFFHWASFGHVYAEQALVAEHAVLVALTERLHGMDQADHVRFWLVRQPEAFSVFKSQTGDIVGFSCGLALHEATQQDLATDPGTRAMWDYVQRHGPPRPGEEVVAYRFFVDTHDGGEGPTEAQNAVAMRHVQEIFTRRRPAWDLVGAYTDVAYWTPIFGYIDFHRAVGADYEVGGRRYAVFAHDWREVDRERWLDLMTHREIGGPVAPPSPPATEIMLAQPDFAQAVREALRALHRPGDLARNPLAKSRLVRGADDPVVALRELLSETAAELRGDPRDERYYRALDRTFLRPAPTQERAAEVLGLPFSTYRRYLTRGIEHVVTRLWHRELYGVSKN